MLRATFRARVPAGVSWKTFSALLVLTLVGVVGYVCVGQVKFRARQIVTDSMPGLSYASEVNTRLARAFHSTLLLVTAEDEREKARLRREVESCSSLTAASLEAYKSQLFEAEDVALFEQCQRRRGEYLRVRNDVLSLVDQGQRPAAAVLLRTELLPAYQGYEAASERLLQYNMRQGQDRGETITRVCTATQGAIAFIGVAIFVLGFSSGRWR